MEVKVHTYMLKNAEVLGHLCADLGKCHHKCEVSCFRKQFCSPLTGATWLTLNWKLKE
jgi:hypothetical protein